MWNFICETATIFSGGDEWSMIYLHSYVDCSFVIGDLNCRLSEKHDAIASVGDVPKRCVIDTIQNKHSDAFLDSLMEARMALLNGRVGEVIYDFTSVSPRENGNGPSLHAPAWKYQ